MALSKGDVHRIAEAVKKGIEASRPEPKKRWWHRLVWGVVFLFLLSAGIAGYFGFAIRPPQNATFRSEFPIGAIVHVKANPGLQHEINGVVSGLEFGGHDTPILVRIPVSPDRREEFTAALGMTEPASPIEIKGPVTTLSFSPPVLINVRAEMASEVAVKRNLGGDSDSQIQFTAKNYPRESDSGHGPMVTVTIYPPTQPTSCQIVKNDETIGSFDLYIGMIEEEIMEKVLMTAYPLGEELGDTIDLSFAGIEPNFQASFSKLKSDSKANLQSSEQHIDINDTTGGVLSWGVVTQTLAAGERLYLRLDHPQQFSIINNRVIFDALGESRIDSAVRNDVVQLLPQRFSLWPYWGQQLWQWGAISTGTTTFLYIMRRLNLWPS